MDEDYFVDDAIRGLDAEAVIMQSLQSGELFKVTSVVGATEGLVGLAIIRDIRHQRDAVLEAWTHPYFRGKYPCSKAIRDVLNYCFAPWNPEKTGGEKREHGLGLAKLKAEVSAMNIPAHRGLWRLGFTPIGRSPIDGLFKGNLTDMILVEKLNPALLVQPEVISNGEGRQTPGDTVIPATGAIPAAESSGEPVEHLRSAGINSDSVDKPSEPDRGNAGVSKGAKGRPTAILDELSKRSHKSRSAKKSR